MSDLPYRGADAIASRPAEAAGQWTLLSRIVAQVSQVGVFLLAARFLSPAEFGIFALVQAFSALLFVAASAGWREVIISTAETQLEVGQLISFAFFSGLVMALIGLLASAGLLALGHEQPGWLAALFSVCVLFAPIVSALNGLLVRQGKVKALVLASIVAECVAFATTVLLLFADRGVYALVIGKIAFLMLSTVLLLWQSKWSGRLGVSGLRTRLLLTTSGHILANRIIFTVQSNGSTFLVGAFLGPAGVGFFRAAERVVSSVSELVTEPLRMIAWVELRREADKSPSTDPAYKQKLSDAATALLPLLVFLAAPVFVGLGFVARDLILFALGPAWVPSGGVATILAVAALAVIPGLLAEPLLSLSGEIRHLSRILLLNTGVTAVCMLLLGPFGLVAVALASIPIGLFSFASTLWVLQRHGGFRARKAMQGAALVLPPLAAMGLAVLTAQFWMRDLDFSLYMRLFLQIVSGAAAYVGVLLLVKPDVLQALRQL